MAAEKVTKNTAYLVSAFVGQKLLSFLYFTLVARSVGVDGAGRYFIAVSFTTIWSVFVDLGLANVLVREVAKKKERAQELLSSVLGLKLIFAAGSVIAAIVTARILGYDEEIQLMISIATVVMVLDSVHLVFYAVMRGFQNLKYEAIGVVSGQFVTITTGSIFLYLGLPLPFLIVALLAGSTWNVLWSAFAMKRWFGVGLKFSLDREVVAFFWSVTIPFALAGIFSRVYSYIDSILLSKLISETAVGLYSVAYKVAFAFQFLPMAFAAAIYPAMSEYYVSDKEKLKRLYSVSLHYLLVVVAPLCFGVLAVAQPFIVMVYSQDFVGSVLPLQILMFSLIFAFLYWPAGSLLNASDRQAKNTTVMGVTMVVNIALNLVLVPLYAEVGAAISALIGNAVLFAGAFMYARSVTSIDGKHLISVAVRVLISAVAMWFVVVKVTALAGVFVSVPIGALVYLGMLLTTGGISWDEMKKAMNIFLRRGKGVSDIVT